MAETGAQLFARLESRQSLRDIEPRLFPENVGPENGEVVEIFGPEGTGKTELLYLLVCGCVLPRSAGGLEISVVFVDTDFSLDLPRLVQLLEHRLHTAAPSGGPDEALLRSCLSRVLVLHCASSSQLLLTLHFLEAWFSSRPDLSLLLVDSISAFYWLDRAEGGTCYARQEEKLSRCSELLGRLLRDYKITVFATCHSIRQNTSSVPSSAPSSSSSSASAPSSSSSSAPSSSSSSSAPSSSSSSSAPSSSSSSAPSSSSSSSAPSSSSCPSSSSLDQDRPYLCRAWQKLVSHRLTCSKTESVLKPSAGAASSPGPERRRDTTFTVHCSSRNRGSRANRFTVTDSGVQFITD